MISNNTVQAFDTSKIKEWRRAKKTKGLLAKHGSAVILESDELVWTKMLVQTLEGIEPFRKNAMVCLGEAGDVWQQTNFKLLDKYNIIDINSDGWLVCMPKDGNVVEFYETTKEDTLRVDASTDYKPLYGEGYVVGHWGAEVCGVKNLQKFSEGDVIVRNPNDKSDVWVVQRTIWMNTYSEL